MSGTAPKWDRTATVGLVFVLVLLAAVALVIFGAAQKNASDAPFYVASTQNVDLPTAQLTAAESLISPLLLSEIDSFDDVYEINHKQAIKAVLNDLAYVYADQNDDGAYVVGREEFEARFFELFGIAPDEQRVVDAADYDGVSDAYLFFPGGYHGDYTVSVVSTRTLENTVYVTAQTLRPVEPEESVPDVSEPDETDFKESENGEGDPETESAVDDVFEGGAESESDTESIVESDTESIVESIIDSDIESEPEIEYEVVKTAVFTIVYTDGGYHVSAMRYM